MAGLLSHYSAQQLLDRFLREKDERRAEPYLETLLRAHLYPILERIIRTKLKLKQPYPTGSLAEQAWDLSEVSVLRHLMRAKEGEVAPPSDVRGYAAMIAFNSISYVLNEADPHYRLFRLRVVDTLKRNEKHFALWEEARKKLCSFVLYKEVVVRMSALWERLMSEPQKLLAEDPTADQDPLVVVIHRLLHRLKHPVLVEPLSQTLAKVRGVEKTTEVSLDPKDPDDEGGGSLQLPAMEDTAKTAERRHLIDLTLEAMDTLDLRRRIILLLASLDEFKAQALATDSEHTPKRIQALLKWDDQAFHAGWEKGTHSDQEIATLLDISTSNVAYLRNDARAKLQKAMKKVWE